MNGDLLTASQSELGYLDAEGFLASEDAPAPGARDFVWRDLRDKCSVDSAYFFGAEPLVAFGRGDDEAEVQRLRKRLWNFGRVPVLIASTGDRVSAYSCYVPPSSGTADSTGLLRSAGNVTAVAQVLSDFARASMETGQYALSDPGAFSKTQRVDQHLLRSLRDLRRPYTTESSVQTAVDHLVGQAIFVRYLEDRAILTPDHVRELSDCIDLITTLEDGRDATFRLLTGLSSRFNGDVFTLSDLEREQITDDHCAVVAAFFSGTDLNTGQQTLWPFDFSVIPPELVSSIYEQLLEQSQKADAAYYTPRELVTAMLDEVVPWQLDKPQSILDPACGSGVFLTEAFRRSVYQMKVRRAERPDLRSLTATMKSSIFGTDQSEQAIRVSAFSLYLALLEEADPPAVWDQVRLPTLVGENLLVADFFEADFGDRRFDVVVANPPWKSDLTESASDYLAGNEHPVADKQIAVAFLWKSIDLLSSGGSLAILMPAKPLLHNKAAPALAVRRRLFSVLEVETVIDLSPLRRRLFSKATSPGAIVVGSLPRDGAAIEASSDILHAVARDSPLQAAVDGLVISSDDVHQVSKAMAASSPDVWKVLVWGDERDLKLILRLRGNQSLGALAKQRGWTTGHGFQVTGKDENDASHLVGKRMVEADTIEPFGSPEFSRNRHSIMHRPRNPLLYLGPHVLVRVGFHKQLPAATFLAEDAAFPHGVIGIAGQSEDSHLLSLVTIAINSTIGRYFQFMTSASWGVEREFVEVGEHLALPLPPWEGSASARLRTLARRVADGRDLAELRQEEIDDVVSRALGLDETDMDHVSEVMSLRHDQFSRGPKSFVYAQPDSDLTTAYSEVLRHQLSQSLPSLKTSVSASAAGPGHRAVTVAFGIRRADAEASPQSAQSGLERLLEGAPSYLGDTEAHSIYLQRSFVVVDHDVALIVKPDERRLWTRESAVSDAADVVGAVLSLPT